MDARTGRDVRILSLFTGVGGLDLGVCEALRGLGYSPRVVCAVEGELYPVCLLAQKARQARSVGGDYPIWSDVTTFDARPWRGAVDLCIGGWPCTNTSVAGNHKGLEGEKSALFFEFARILEELGCPVLFMENVGGVFMGDVLATVCGTLASLGYDLEYATLRACDVGAPHRRERWFCLGVGDADIAGLEGPERPVRSGKDKPPPGEGGAALASFPPGPDEWLEWERMLRDHPELAPAAEVEPRLRRVDHGDARVDRLRALGNSCVPQQAKAALTALLARLGVVSAVPVDVGPEAVTHELTCDLDEDCMCDWSAR